MDQPTPSRKPVGLLSTLVHRIFDLLTSLLLYLISLGPLPKHVAFVMDGNRRYAKGRGKKVSQGHSEGFESLRRNLEVCLKLHIPAVTVYAFSIDNFRRSKDEVNHLMSLAKTKLLELSSHGDLLNKYGVRIRFIGRREMLPEDVRRGVEKMEAMTAGNRNGVLNVCSPYTSSDEATTAVRDTVQEIYDGSFPLQNVTHQRIFSNLETTQSIASISQQIEDCGKIDIFVRTSNVKRLSDFQMWQAGDDTQLHFVKTYWPDFGVTDFAPILLGWQQKVWLRSLGW